MLRILHLLCEDVSKVENPWNVPKDDVSMAHGITDSHFTDIEVSELLRNGFRERPADTPLIVIIEEWCWVLPIRDTDFAEQVLQEFQ